VFSKRINLYKFFSTALMKKCNNKVESTPANNQMIYSITQYHHTFLFNFFFFFFLNIILIVIIHMTINVPFPLFSLFSFLTFTIYRMSFSVHFYTQYEICNSIEIYYVKLRLQSSIKSRKKREQ
jgi:hypothetical protein